MTAKNRICQIAGNCYKGGYDLIKLVAIDLDDTLLDNSLRISPRAREAIRMAMERGVTVTVATGRMFRSALPYAQQLNLDVPIITYNGALIKTSLTQETLLHQPIDKVTADALLKLFKQNGWYIQAYVNDNLYVKEEDENTRYYESIAGVKAVPIGDKIYSLPEVPTKLLAIAQPDKLREIHDIIKELFGEKVYAALSKPTYLEILNPQVNKGIALAFLAQRLGISREEIMAVGDSANDLDMIEYAGWGVAMGNAINKVRKTAQTVTGANDADGVAEAIEKYVLGLTR
jgi:Cof subfamily protein (haloacid dehalogenase superfamily)